MRWLLLAAAVLAALVIVVVATGFMLPVAHRATRGARLPASAHDVFALITDVAGYPRWRSGLSRVEIVATGADGAPARFREHSSDGAILYEVVERVPDRRMVTRIADAGLPFGGRWTYELTPDGDGTRLTITEDGEVYNPVFRFVSRFVMGHTASIDRYLADASKALAR